VKSKNFDGLLVRSSMFSLSRFKVQDFLLLVFAATSCAASSPDALFRQAADAYRAADYSTAANGFRDSVALRPASGALQNLGNAEWRRNRTGVAILAWEQALWLDPFNKSAHNNLRFARKTAQLEAPDLGWYEVASTWLPANWWAWTAGLSFWAAVAATLLPGIFRRPKAAWHQAVAAMGIMIFLLTLPAHFGIHTRSRIGFVLQKDAPLRLTPTQEAQSLARLTAGEPARLQRSRGDYFLVRTARAQGWIERDQFGLIFPAH
jgi:hypothetical protein